MKWGSVTGVVVLIVGAVAFVLFMVEGERRNTQRMRAAAKRWGELHGVVAMDCTSGRACTGMHCTITMPDGRLLGVECPASGCHLTGRGD